MNFNISYFLSKNWILIHMYVGILQVITLVDCSTQFIDAWGTKDICFSIARYRHASLTTESNLILPDATTVAPSSNRLWRSLDPVVRSALHGQSLLPKYEKYGSHTRPFLQFPSLKDILYKVSCNLLTL